MPSTVWDEITYPFLNFNGCTIEVWEWINIFIPHFVMDVITYPCRDLSKTMLVKGATGYRVTVWLGWDADVVRIQGWCFWCAILIAHQLLWQNMEAPVSIFQESPLAGEPRERLFHIHSIHRYQLCAKYLHPSTLLWKMNGCNPSQQHWCCLFGCWKFNDV